MESQLVSIVTPSYNQAQYLPETLEAVRAQQYEPIEHIVVDGNSNDNTISVLEEYEDTYNLTWISESDDGQADAVNKGFEMAEGDIIGWINSDDLYFDETVTTRVVSEFNENPECDVIYGDFVETDANGIIDMVYRVPEYDRELLRYGNYIPQPGVFFKKKVTNDNDLDTNLVFVLDYEYWLRLSKNGYKFHHLDEIIAGYRIHDEAKGPRLGRDRQIEEQNQIMNKYGGNNKTKKIQLIYHRVVSKLSSVVSTAQYRGKVIPILDRSTDDKA